MKARHVLIVGGAGFVGGWTARAFLDAAWSVTVLDPAAAVPDRVPEGCHTIARSSDLAETEELLRAQPAHAVVALGAYGAGGAGLLSAAVSDPGAAVAQNAGGLATLLEAASRTNTRRVLWSSSTVVYGQTTDGTSALVKESHPPDPDTAYGLSKHLAEVTAQWFRAHRSQISPTGIRLPLVLGPGLHYRGAAARFVDAVAGGEKGMAPTASPDDFLSDVLYVKDVARLFVHLAEFAGDLAPIYNAPAFPLRFSDFLDLLRQHGVATPSAEPRSPRAGPAKAWRTLDSARLRRDTGYVPEFDAAGMVSDWLEEAGTVCTPDSRPA